MHLPQPWSKTHQGDSLSTTGHYCLTPIVGAFMQRPRASHQKIYHAQICREEERVSCRCRKAPVGGRPGLLPPCRRAGPTGECASLGDVTMQPVYCGNSIWNATCI